MAKNRSIEQKQYIRRWLWRYKKEHHCVKCGEEHPACLEFHHKNKHEKEVTIAHAIKKGWTLSQIKKEIAKCMVLCKNCHAKEHFDNQEIEDKYQYNNYINRR